MGLKFNSGPHSSFSLSLHSTFLFLHFVFFFALLLSSSPCCFPLIVVAFLFASHCCSLLRIIILSLRRVVILLFTLLLSYPCCWSFLRPTLLFSSSCRAIALLFALLLSFSCHAVALLFMLHCCFLLRTALLLSSSRRATIFSFALLLSFSPCYSPLGLLFYFRYKFDLDNCNVEQSYSCYYSLLASLLLLVCCYSLKNLLLPLAFLLTGIGNGRKSRIENLYFSISNFPLSYFHLKIILISCFLFLFLFEISWLLVCGVGFDINCFGNKHKPLYF